MVQDTDTIPRAVIDEIVAKLERLADEACNRWTITKSDDPVRIASWRNREIGYRDALKLLAEAGVARSQPTEPANHPTLDVTTPDHGE